MELKYTWTIVEVTAPAQAFRSESRLRTLEKLMSDNWTEVMLVRDVGDSMC